MVFNKVLILIYIIGLTLFNHVNATIIIQNRNGTQFELPAVEVIFLESTNERISEPVVLEPTIRPENATGRLYLMNDSFNNDVIILQMQSQGALAVIEVSSAWVVGGFLRFRFTDREAVRSIKIPIFEITKAEAGILWPLLEQDQVLNITLVPSDEPNPWDVVLLSPGFYVFTIFLLVFSATNISLAIWKMKLFIAVYGGVRVSFSLFVLLLEVISNLIRFIAMIDLFGANNLYTQTVSWVFYHLSFPFHLSSLMLFILYWHEIMTTSSIVVHPFIVKMRIPFFVASALLLLLQIALVLIGVLSIGDFAAAGTFVYLSVSFLLFVFYVVTGIKLLIRLKRSQKSGRKNRNLRQSTIKMMISMGFLLIMIIIGIIFIFYIAYTPIGYFMCWCSLYASINATSLLSILAFGKPSKSSSASSNNKHSTPKQDSSAADSIKLATDSTTTDKAV